MSSIPVTLLYGGLSGLWLTALGINVSRSRGKHGANVEQGIPSPMLRVHRAHGNAMEWIPLGMVLLLLNELGGGQSLTLHLLGGTFLTGRVLHGAGMLFNSKITAVGAGLNYLCLLLMSLLALAHHFS